MDIARAIETPTTRRFIIINKIAVRQAGENRVASSSATKHSRARLFHAAGCSRARDQPHESVAATTPDLV
jgi:hypothetical protein